MAGDFRGLALEKAELLSSRLRELVSSGQGFVRAQFGVDLGLKPELYPSWLILSTAAVGLLLLLGASWAAVCCGGGGGLLVSKKRAYHVSQGGEETKTTSLNNKSVKPEEQKKRNKKKTGDKKTQPNGQPLVAAQQEVKETETLSKPAPPLKAEKVHEVQAPAQLKKNRKKPKSDAKPVQLLSTSDGKEPDDGVWETKVSNREKRQQRRKDKGSEGSGSPGSVEASKPHVETPTAPITNKKKSGNNENQHSRPSAKGDPSSGKGKAETFSSSSTWKGEPTVNGGAWADGSLKVTGQSGSAEEAKWSSMSASVRYRPQTDPKPWAQEPPAWSSTDGKMKTMPFSVLQLNSTDPASNSAKMHWVNQSSVDDQWSGFKGAAVDSASDWNAPAEHWGNYEEPPILVAAETLQKDQPKISEDEKDIDNPSEGAAKAKKKRNKKKKTEEEPVPDAQTPSAMTKAPERPALPLNSQNTSISSSQKKSEQTIEPQEPSQKKRVRKET
ncbi:metadherin a isoform X2 [Cyprinodon tularosa]|uniref:metadherin a isoform X2 n=1 Tax=Cyprinodon tularosa TaxID=77115 RepID=UPI0018E28BFF|nr:metadherin a isoform X2 [Cyprinodon tularosa]